MLEPRRRTDWVGSAKAGVRLVGLRAIEWNVAATTRDESGEGVASGAKWD